MSKKSRYYRCPKLEECIKKGRKFILQCEKDRKTIMEGVVVGDMKIIYGTDGLIHKCNQRAMESFEKK